MMQITFDGFRVTAAGHAGYAEPGQDIVCAGVSALLCTAAQRLTDLAGMGLLAEAPGVTLEPGNIFLEARPTEPGREQTEAVFRFLETGCRMIAAGYPENIVIHSSEGL